MSRPIVALCHTLRSDGMGQLTTAGTPHRTATLVVARARNRYSQTFVRNHIARLPGDVVVLYGRSFKLETEDGRLLVTGSAERAARMAEIVGRGASVRKRARSRAVAAFCDEYDVGVAMAEFGPTAASICLLLLSWSLM